MYLSVCSSLPWGQTALKHIQRISHHSKVSLKVPNTGIEVPEVVVYTIDGLVSMRTHTYMCSCMSTHILPVTYCIHSFLHNTAHIHIRTYVHPHTANMLI